MWISSWWLGDCDTGMPLKSIDSLENCVLIQFPRIESHFYFQLFAFSAKNVFGEKNTGHQRKSTRFSCSNQDDSSFRMRNNNILPSKYCVSIEHLTRSLQVVCLCQYFDQSYHIFRCKHIFLRLFLLKIEHFRSAFHILYYRIIYLRHEKKKSFTKVTTCNR